MGGLGSLYSNANRNVDEFGGEPFAMNKGTSNFRGVNPHKKANFHPSETTKRVIYQTDGSGRDMYITSNNGGLSIHNYSGVNGTDIISNYARNLRGYNKEVVSNGLNTKGA